MIIIIKKPRIGEAEAVTLVLGDVEFKAVWAFGGMSQGAWCSNFDS